jgi:hypothetical protein
VTLLSVTRLGVTLRSLTPGGGAGRRQAGAEPVLT